MNNEYKLIKQVLLDSTSDKIMNTCKDKDILSICFSKRVIKIIDLKSLDIISTIKLEGSGCIGDVFLKENKLFLTPTYNKLIEIEYLNFCEDNKEIIVPKVLTRDIIKEKKIHNIVHIIIISLIYPIFIY